MLKESTNELQGCADGETDKSRPPCPVLDEHPRPNRAAEIPDEYETVCHRNGVLSSAPMRGSRVTEVLADRPRAAAHNAYRILNLA